LEPHRSKGFRSSAYEIKISRADFNRDSEEKQAYALAFTDRFWYVTPQGMIDKAEVPEWAGLQEWDGRFFHIRKKPPMRTKADPTWEFVVSLIRNSGETRRDIGLMKSEINFLKIRNDRLEQQAKIRQDRTFRRFTMKAASRTALRERERRMSQEVPILEIGDDEPIPLAEAARLFFGGRLSKSSLRTEAAKGNLEIIRIANKDFVTRSGIKRMIDRCRVREVQPASGSEAIPAHGSSRMEI